MRLIEKLLTKNPCYSAGKKIEVKGLMLHSVGCSQPDAMVFVNNWDSPDYDRACVHAFIDGNSGMVYQTLPWEHRGWHCGKGNKGSCNNTHIGVEMCEPACIEYTAGSSFICYDREAARSIVKRTYEAAVELFAFLCGEYGLDPLEDGVILGHNEGHVRGIASNHGDPEHMWKGLSMEYTMDGFRRDVKAAMAGEDEPAETEDAAEDVVWYRVRKSWEDKASQKGAYKILENAVKCAARNAGYFVFDENGNVVYGEAADDVDYVVRDGDTLWSIAGDKLGNGIRHKEIMELNGLVTDTIYPGQILRLPQ